MSKFNYEIDATGAPAMVEKKQKSALEAPKTEKIPFKLRLKERVNAAIHALTAGKVEVFPNIYDEILNHFEADEKMPAEQAADRAQEQLAETVRDTAEENLKKQQAEPSLSEEGINKAAERLGEADAPELAAAQKEFEQIKEEEFQELAQLIEGMGIKVEDLPPHPRQNETSEPQPTAQSESAPTAEKSEKAETQATQEFSEAEKLLDAAVDEQSLNIARNKASLLIQRYKRNPGQAEALAALQAKFKAVNEIIPQFISFSEEIANTEEFAEKHLDDGDFDRAKEMIASRRKSNEINGLGELPPELQAQINARLDALEANIKTRKSVKNQTDRLLERHDIIDDQEEKIANLLADKSADSLKSARSSVAFLEKFLQEPKQAATVSGAQQAELLARVSELKARVAAAEAALKSPTGEQPSTPAEPLPTNENQEEPYHEVICVKGQLSPEQNKLVVKWVKDENPEWIQIDAAKYDLPRKTKDILLAYLEKNQKAPIKLKDIEQLLIAEKKKQSSEMEHKEDAKTLQLKTAEKTAAAEKPAAKPEAAEAGKTEEQEKLQSIINKRPAKWTRVGNSEYRYLPRTKKFVERAVVHAAGDTGRKLTIAEMKNKLAKIGTAPAAETATPAPVETAVTETPTPAPAETSSTEAPTTKPTETPTEQPPVVQNQEQAGQWTM
jgi:hypothetical protein